MGARTTFDPTSLFFLTPSLNFESRIVDVSPGTQTVGAASPASFQSFERHFGSRADDGDGHGDGRGIDRSFSREDDGENARASSRSRSRSVVRSSVARSIRFDSIRSKSFF